MEDDSLNKAINQFRGKSKYYPEIKIYKDSKFKNLKTTVICAFSSRTNFVASHVKDKFRKRFEKKEVLKFLQKDFIFKN